MVPHLSTLGECGFRLRWFIWTSSVLKGNFFTKSAKLQLVWCFSLMVVNSSFRAEECLLLLVVGMVAAELRALAVVVVVVMVVVVVEVVMVGGTSMLSLLLLVVEIVASVLVATVFMSVRMITMALLFATFSLTSLLNFCA